jgi:hypothetical protein
MWEWEEVQKMLRRLSFSLGIAIFGLAGLPLQAAMFPEQLGTVLRGPVHPAGPPDAPLFEEYGFEAGERTDYGSMMAVAWRFKDSTGALAAYQAIRPADSKPSKLDKLAVTAGHVTITAHGNYVFQFTDGQPSAENYAQIIAKVPKLESAPLPIVSSYLPAANLIPNSERYIMGPVSLEKFDPGIAPSTAAFHLSSEAQFGKYQTPGGELDLAVFWYPTPTMARDRADAFQKTPGAIAKRTGALVAVVMHSPNPDSAERLLSKINYKAQLTITEKPQETVQTAARMMLSIFKLAGIIMLFCILSGLGFAGIRILFRKLGHQDASDEMTTLHLGGK